MSTPVGRRSNLLLITLLLAISVLLEQFFIAPILPWLGNLGSIRPMVVFLDIPLALPAIDLLPVSIIFALFYQVAPSAGLAKEHPSIPSGARVWKALSGLWMLLILLVAGGSAYYYAQDYLPRSVSNGIDSFGVRADLTLPYPSGGLIHLHGSVVMFAFSALGVFILNRRTATPAAAPAVQPQAEPLSKSVVSSAGTLISPSINEVLAAQQQPQPQPRQRQQPEEDPHARYQPATIIPGYEKPLIPASKPAAATIDPFVASATTAVAEPAAAPAPKAEPAPKAKPIAEQAPPSTRSYVQKPAPRTTTIITPEPPPTCRLTTPPPIAVVMPRPAPGVGKMHPCYVIGSLKPVKTP